MPLQQIETDIKKKARIKVNSWLVQEAKQSGAAMLGPPAHHALRGT